MTWDEKEKQALDLIAQGQKAQAIKLIYELIVHYAHKNDFSRADRLRKTLIQTDSMALTEIINSGEIIDEQKSKAIDVNHKKMWNTLYDSFSSEETNGFYFALKSAEIPAGKTIIQQGKLNDKLFFINSGTLNTICNAGTQTFFIKEIEHREIVGSSTFFSISLATTTVLATSAVKLNYLTRKALSGLIEILPGFEAKLGELCQKFIKTDSTQIVTSQKIERRKYQRFPLDGRVGTYFLDSEGKPTEQPLIGVLTDLSQGGASFVVRCTTKEIARSLLGRTAVIKILSKKGKAGPKETKTGLVTALDDQLFNDYSISFKFIKPMTLETLRRFTDS